MANEMRLFSFEQRKLMPTNRNTLLTLSLYMSYVGMRITQHNLEQKSHASAQNFTRIDLPHISKHVEALY